MRIVIIKQSLELPYLSMSNQNTLIPLVIYANIVLNYVEQEMPLDLTYTDNIILNKLIQCMHIMGTSVSAIVESKMFKEMTAHGILWKCTDCEYHTKGRRGLFEHIESKHVGSEGYTCHYCQKFCPSRNALRSHMARHHPIKGSKIT